MITVSDLDLDTSIAVGLSKTTRQKGQFYAFVVNCSPYKCPYHVRLKTYAYTFTLNFYYRGSPDFFISFIEYSILSTISLYLCLYNCYTRLLYSTYSPYVCTLLYIEKKCTAKVY